MAYAGGGSLGMTPGSGFKLRFAGGGTDGLVPFDFRLEWRVDEEEKHGIGTDFGADLGTGGYPNVFRLNPYYHYYLNGVGGWYIGADFGIDVGKNTNLISIGPKAGYKADIKKNPKFAVYGETGLGFSTFGSSALSGRSNGGYWNFKVGALFNFGGFAKEEFKPKG
jgi:hypothetical protein